MAETRDAGLEVSPTALQQPAIAARCAPLLRQLRRAAVVSVLGMACSLAASQTLVRFASTSRLWPMLANLASVLVAVASLLQFHCWRQAYKEWAGEKDVALMHLLPASHLGRWVSLASAVVGPWACLQVFRQSALQDAAHWLAVAAAACIVLGTGFGGLHALDPAGPRGVAPSRLRFARRPGAAARAPLDDVGNPGRPDDDAPVRPLPGGDALTENAAQPAGLATSGEADRELVARAGGLPAQQDAADTGEGLDQDEDTVVLRRRRLRLPGVGARARQ